MSNHFTKTSYGQCKCLWCGRFRSSVDCPLTDEMRGALAAYATKHGRLWKSALRHSWETGDYASDEPSGVLQVIRNQFGPSWLVTFPTRLLK